MRKKKLRTIWGYQRNCYFRLVHVDKPPPIFCLSVYKNTMIWEKRTKFVYIDVHWQVIVAVHAESAIRCCFEDINCVKDCATCRSLFKIKYTYRRWRDSPKIVFEMLLQINENSTKFIASYLVDSCFDLLMTKYWSI